jgi:pimeloyl-ACP methyl ester carboxylesterase
MEEEHPIVVGVSFGGMLATEMAKNDPLLRAIIISSNKTAKEFPGYLRIWKKFPVYRWVPGKLTKLVGQLSAPIMGPKGKEQKKLFKEIVSETNPDFNSWAIDAILHWKNQVVPPNVIQIHGNADTLLPYKLVRPEFTIKGGTHLMIMDHAAELSEILKKQITTHTT